MEQTIRRWKWWWLPVILVTALTLFALLDYPDFKAGAKLTGRFFKTVGITLKNYGETADPGMAGVTLAGLGFMDSSFTPVPEANDLLVVYFTIRHTLCMPWFVLASALGSLLGSMVLFAMGRRGGDILLRRKVSVKKMEKIKAWFDRNGVWAILIPCIVPPPMPFKLFVLTAGVMQFTWRKFILATIFGRLIRYGIWGVLAVIYREEILTFMRNNLLEVGVGISLVLLALLLAGWFYSNRLKHDEANDEPADGSVSLSSGAVGLPLRTPDFPLSAISEIPTVEPEA